MPRSAKSTPQPRSASLKAGTPKTKAHVLKKSDIEVILLSTQKKLFDAETALEAQTEEIATLREGFYDAQVKASLAEHKYQSSQKTMTRAMAEISHLTLLLVQSNDTADSDMEAAQAEAASLQNQLKAVQAEAKDATGLRKLVAEQSQRLAVTTREIADLTALLAESEAHQQDEKGTHKQDAEIGRAAIRALIYPPGTVRLDQERLNRAAAALVASKEFDPDWYLEQNGDVAENGIDPALHFLEFGFAEGRSPRAPE